MLEAAFAPHVDSYRGYTPSSLYNRTLRWGDQPGVPGASPLYLPYISPIIAHAVREVTAPNPQSLTPSPQPLAPAPPARAGDSRGVG